MKVVHRSVAAALLAPMLVLAVSAWGFVGLRCRITGMVSVVTCCPHDDAAAVAGQSRVGESGCCERVSVDNAKPAAAGVAAAPERLVQVSAIKVMDRITALASSVGAFGAAADPPPHPRRTPLQLLHRSLLI